MHFRREAMHRDTDWQVAGEAKWGLSEEVALEPIST